MRFGLSFRPLIAFCALLAVLAVAVVDADARSRVSFGSRGSKTFTAPPTTQTAPNQARPVERTMAQPSQPATAGTAARPNTPAPAGGLLNRPGILGGFAAGFLGAGLIGLLLGHGLTGGLGGFASILGLLLQVGLVVGVGYMLWSWWQRRSQPALAGGPSLRDAGPSQPMGLGGLGGGGAASPRSRRQRPTLSNLRGCWARSRLPMGPRTLAGYASALPRRCCPTTRRSWPRTRAAACSTESLM